MELQLNQQLDQLPNHWKGLSNLRYLNLGTTQLKQPFEQLVATFPKLRYLELDAVSLAEIPLSISVLTDLETLKLTVCEKVLDLRALAKLRKIKPLAYTQNIPFTNKQWKELFKLQQIEFLDLGFSDVFSDPKTLKVNCRKLPSLKGFSIAQNAQTTYTLKGIGLDQLTTLKISNFNLNQLEKILVETQNLNQLHLHSTNDRTESLKKVSSWIAQNKNLEQLDLDLPNV